MARYGKKAGETVEAAMKALKAGTLESGSGETVTDPKQAVAIGLSQARKAGGKVPPEPGASTKKASAKKASAKKASAKKAPVKKATARRAATKTAR